MLVGHAAVAFAGKRAVPESSLGALMLAAFAADLGWAALSAAGVEHATMIDRGPTLMRSVVAFDFAYSHSLLGLAIVAVVFAMLALVRRRPRRAAAFLAVAVLSHWLLDVISHHPDMPLVPGGRPLFGLGLWDSIPATVVVEGGAWLAAVIAFARLTRPRTRAARWLFWPGVILLTLAWWNNVAGPPPPNLSGMAATSGIFFSLVVAWAFSIG